MNILVLIERDPIEYASWPSLMQIQKSPQTLKEILSKYQGFEGEGVCFFEIKKECIDLNEQINECLKFKELGSCFLLFVISDPIDETFFKGQAIKMGYDVGVCEEEKTIYSSIFQEVLFGHINELIFYKKFLNKNFLFSDAYTAKKYVEVHNEMSVLGKDVENYEKMNIYEIWKYNRETEIEPHEVNP